MYPSYEILFWWCCYFSLVLITCVCSHHALQLPTWSRTPFVRSWLHALYRMSSQPWTLKWLWAKNRLYSWIWLPGKPLVRWGRHTLTVTVYWLVSCANTLIFLMHTLIDSTERCDTLFYSPRQHKVSSYTPTPLCVYTYDGQSQLALCV